MKLSKLVSSLLVVACVAFGSVNAFAAIAPATSSQTAEQKAEAVKASLQGKQGDALTAAIKDAVSAGYPTEAVASALVNLGFSATSAASAMTSASIPAASVGAALVSAGVSPALASTAVAAATGSQSGSTGAGSTGAGSTGGSSIASSGGGSGGGGGGTVSPVR